MERDSLQHHGILGQKWGIRRYQNPDGTLTAKGKKHYAKLDSKWMEKNSDRIYKETFQRSKREMNDYVTGEFYNKYADRMESGNYNRSMINDYNRKLADLMNKNVDDIESPSGKIVQFVAKRGEAGVHFALATPGYDMSQVKNGVWNSGRVAYRKDSVQKG